MHDDVVIYLAMMQWVKPAAIVIVIIIYSFI